MELKKTLLMPKTNFEMRGNLPNKEPSLVKYWDDIDLYHLLLKKNAGKEEFSFHDGPPYANGNIHCGHMLNRLIKDFIVRYKAMSGYYTPFRFGFDTHGLPIENQVTKNGIDRKKVDIVSFRDKCKEYALKQVANQSGQIMRLGVIGDIKHPYLTLDKEYEAHQVEIFASMALKGLIYKGLKPVYWSPSSESALAEAEIEYHDIDSHSLYVAFPLLDGKGLLDLDTKLVIWTTTPWTLPANLAISVHPRFEYGLYQTSKGKLVFLTSLADTLKEELSLGEMTLIKTFKGLEMDGILAKHPFYDRSSMVIVGEHVTSDSGTGLVHTAPGHGNDDYVVCTKYHIAPYCPVDDKGYFDDSVGERLKGLFYEDANAIVLDILKENNLLLKDTIINHAYPHDWRTKKPLIFRATPQWFCSIDKIKGDLLKAIDQINWLPSWGSERMYNMINDRTDWCISRQRAWGVPLPIIYGEDGHALIEKEIFDNIASIFKKEGSSIWFKEEASYFLPKGYHSEHSPHNIFTKEKDIMDVWFDSGSSFYSVMIKDGQKYPCDLYMEGNDQYRGWFNSSLILSVATQGKAAFKACLTHGWVLDEDSEKMSKSKGNGVDPSKVANMLGADILRLWASTIDYRQDVRLSDDILKQVSEQYRRIRNTFKFLLSNLYHDDERLFDPQLDFVESEEFVDRAILAKLELIKNQMIEAFDNYDFASGIMKLSNYLVSDLSSFYLDITKDILYCDSLNSLRRKEVQSTLYIIENTLMRLLAPILPFTMEEVYRNSPNALKQSVALEDYPKISHIYHEEILKDYEEFNRIRAIVLKGLEEYRKNGLIGSSQEAHVILPHKYLDFFKKYQLIENESELAHLFIVSKVTFSDDDCLQVKNAHGQKCPRCWNYVDELKEIEGEKVCSRCYEVIKNV